MLKLGLGSASNGRSAREGPATAARARRRAQAHNAGSLSFQTLPTNTAGPGRDEDLLTTRFLSFVFNCPPSADLFACAMSLCTPRLHALLHELTASLSRASLGSVRGLHTSRPALRGTKNLDWYHRALRQQEFEKQRGAAPPPFPVETLHSRPRARCYMDFTFGVAGDKQGEGAAAAAPAGAGATGAAAAAAAAAAGAAPAAAPAAAAPVHRVVFELADDIVPVTVGNFLALCAQQPGYVGSAIFRAQRGFAVFGGDWERGNGRGGHSSFAARYFPDENFIGRHTAPGVLAMASSGVHSNASAFYVTLAPATHLGE